jgi:hypothetical protein
MTFGLGQAAKIYYQTGMKTSMEDLQEVFRQAAEEFMRENKNKRSVN